MKSMKSFSGWPRSANPSIPEGGSFCEHRSDGFLSFFGQAQSQLEEGLRTRQLRVLEENIKKVHVQRLKTLCLLA